MSEISLQSVSQLVTSTKTELDTKINNKVDKTQIADGTAPGLMSKEDKVKLNSITAGAAPYTHPAGDGNLHVPATGTANNGKILKAGATAGSATWATLTPAEIGAAASTHVHTGAQIDAPRSDVAKAVQTAAELKWTYYGNNHTILDNSLKAYPKHTNGYDAATAWVNNYPVLVGYNGTTTYGVRVDSARVCDLATNSNALNGLNSSAFVQSDGKIATGTLQTAEKTNIIGAVNELFTNVSSGKTQIATAITGKGVAASGSDTFAVLATKIGQLGGGGKRYATGSSSTIPITVNLGWQPSTVLIRNVAAGGVYGGFWCYFPTTFQYRYQRIIGGDGYYVPYTYDYPVAATYNLIYMTYNGGVGVTNETAINATGFSAYCPGYNGASFVWYAWE